MPAEVGEPTVNPKSKAEKYAKSPKSVVQKDTSVRPTAIEKKIGSGVICYQALKYNGATVADPLANPWDFHVGLQAGHKPGTYFLDPMVGKLLKDMGDFLTAGVTNAKAWVENKINAAKEWAAKKIGEGVDWAKKVGGELASWTAAQWNKVAQFFASLKATIEAFAARLNHKSFACTPKFPVWGKDGCGHDNRSHHCFHAHMRPQARAAANKAVAEAKGKLVAFAADLKAKIAALATGASPAEKKSLVDGVWAGFVTNLTASVAALKSPLTHKFRDWFSGGLLNAVAGHVDGEFKEPQSQLNAAVASQLASLTNSFTQNAPPATSGANELCNELSKDLRPSAGSGPGVNWGNGKAYFFRGKEYTKYDIASDKPEGGYPRAIAGSWGAGFWNGAPDAAVNWGNGFVYFFKGAEYIKYDIAKDAPVAGYPQKIGGNWPGLWADGVDAAVEWDKNTAFFFKGNQYIKYDIKADKVAPGYPQPVNSSSWPGLP